LCRSFGLLGDHVTELEFIDHAGNERKITKSDHPELFFAWLGGSPGNLGVLTHVNIKVHRDQDYQGCIGLKSAFGYSKEKLATLVTALAKMNDNPDFPRNYDLCVNVLSASAGLANWFPGEEDKVEAVLRAKFPGKEPGTTSLPAFIVVYAQWVPFSKVDTANSTVRAWFAQFQGGLLNKVAAVMPMSQVTAMWIFHKTREFNNPYVKRAYVTNATNLSTNGWVSWVRDRIDSIVEAGPGQSLSCQLQCLGGTNSKLVSNAGNGTAYSVRLFLPCRLISALTTIFLQSGAMRQCAWCSMTSTRLRIRLMRRPGKRPMTRDLSSTSAHRICDSSGARGDPMT
jgi:hypothetical protein